MFAYVRNTFHLMCKQQEFRHTADHCIDNQFGVLRFSVKCTYYSHKGLRIKT